MKLLDEERIGNRIDRWYRDGDKIGIQTVSDAQPVIDRNKRAYNDAPEKYGKGWSHKVASFDGVFLEAYCNKKGIPWKEFFAQKTDRSVKAWNELLNSSDFRSFRTRPGYVDVKRK